MLEGTINLMIRLSRIRETGYLALKEGTVEK